MTTPNSDITAISTTLRQHGQRHLWPKTPMIARTPLAPSIKPSPHLPTPPLVPRRILCSTPSGTNGDNMDNNNKIVKKAEERISVIDKKMQELEE